MLVSVLELAISCTGFQRKVTPEISNWMDLYGVSMEAVITNLASYGHLQFLKLGYIDTTGMEYRSLVLCDNDCDGNGNGTRKLYGPDQSYRDLTLLLAESVMGSIPSDFQALFPERTAAIRARIQALEQGIQHEKREVDSLRLFRTDVPRLPAIVLCNDTKRANRRRFCYPVCSLWG